MSGPLDLRTVLFLNVDEVALLFRQIHTEDKVKVETDKETGEEKVVVVARRGDPDRAWVYRNRNEFLRTAARRFGPKTLLFLQSEVARLITDEVYRAKLAKERKGEKALYRKSVKGV